MLTSLSVRCVQDWERAVFASGVSSLDVMERAALSIRDTLQDMLGGLAGKRIVFICGSGNNGGDGLAAARLSAEKGAACTVLLPHAAKTPDAETNRQRLSQYAVRVVAAMPEETFDCAVDCLFGIGFHGEMSETHRALVRAVNALGCPVLSVDVPSGLNAQTGETAEDCVRADRTLTFSALKHGLILTGRPACIGRLMVQDIGLDKSKRSGGCPDVLPVLEERDLKGLLPNRPVTANKGTCGRVLMLCGSPGMAGAGVIAAAAAYRAGAGLVTLLTDAALFPIYQTAVPCAICVEAETVLQKPPMHDVLLMGCGLGPTEKAWERICALYDPEEYSVWDADALNLLSKHPMPLGGRAVMTPHPMEAARLLSVSLDEVIKDPAAAACALSEKYACAVMLKNHVTVLKAKDRMALSPVGSPAQAKGGSGDALAGALAALIAQNRNVPDCLWRSIQAATLWLGAAAKRCERQLGVYSVLVTDVLHEMGAVVQHENGNGLRRTR